MALRLSVEERVDRAVREAVRRALADQRKTQEAELDSLSDVLQRSLTALAGERDRALRLLAVEEDRRRAMVEELAELLGGELSCGDVSRLTMGLERIEQEGEGETAAAPGEVEKRRSGQEDEEEDEGGEEAMGRAWVLEQLGECLHARAAVQDYLQSASDDIAADVFEAEEGLMGFVPGAGGGQDAENASPISCPPPAFDGGFHGGVGGQDRSGGALWSAGSEGVARARAATSQALGKSLRQARERVVHLEALLLEVESGKRFRRRETTTVSSREAPAALPTAPPPRESGKDERNSARGVALEVGGAVEKDVPRQPQPSVSDEGIILPFDGRGTGNGRGGAALMADTSGVADAGSAGSSDGSWSFPSVSGGGRGSGEANRDVYEAAGTAAAGAVRKAATAAGDRDDEVVSGGGGGGLFAEGTPGPSLADEGEKGGEDLSRQHEDRANADAAGAVRSVGQGGSDGGGGLTAPARTETPDDEDVGLPDGSASSLGDTERWRMAARRAEASLVDLRDKSLRDLLILSFRCGEESAGGVRREGGLEGDGEGEGKGDSPRHQQQGCAGDVAGDAASCGDKDRQHGYSEREVVKGGGVGAAGSPAAATATENGAGVSETAPVGGGAGASFGSGTCCGGRGRCSSCEAKAVAVGALLKRLEALSADQGSDIARLEAALKLQQQQQQPLPGTGAGVPSASASIAAANTAVAPAGERSDERQSTDAPSSGMSGRVPPGKSRDEPRTWVAAASAAEGVRREKEHGGGRRAAARDSSPQRDIRTEWEEMEELETHLSHHRGGAGGLGSQAVQDILDRWIDVTKRNILEGWLGHILHGGPIDAANGHFVPRVQISSLSKEVRDGLVTVVLPLLLGRRGILLQVLTRERVELVHDIQIRVTPVVGRLDAPHSNNRAMGAGAAVVGVGAAGSRRVKSLLQQPPLGEKEHGARIRDMVMRAAHEGYVEEDEGGGWGRGGVAVGPPGWRTPLASVDSLSRQLKDTWESFNANFAGVGEQQGGVGSREPVSRGGYMLPEY